MEGDESPACRRQDRGRRTPFEGRGNVIADLVAIGYPDETTVEAAADGARRLAADLIIQPNAIAVIMRDNDGSYHVHTTHHAVRLDDLA